MRRELWCRRIGQYRWEREHNLTRRVKYKWLCRLLLEEVACLSFLNVEDLVDLLQNWTYERILNESPLGCFNDRIKKLRSSSL